MPISEFLTYLQKKYPSKGFHRITHQSADAIGFTHNEMFIHDCSVSSCGRFPQPDYYGINEYDARKMLKFNAKYIELMQ